MDNDLKTYLYNSINDIQSTIRALDAKIGFVFVILSLPFSNLGKIYNTCSSLLTSCNRDVILYAVFFVTFFTMSWILAFISTIRTIISIENPSDHIINGEEQLGTFYCGGLFDVGFVDSLLNRKSVKANKDVRSYTECFPSSDEDIIQELVFEQMKLAYIRDIKSIRQKWAYRFTAMWLSSGLIVYLLNKII
ncbi:MAG: hypothetical protein D3903_19545 [Candidatus Electrothrix sp. GM3_4]|nr:hypothetical protein [Candidatus Electrothrix sp. GM3_4]